MMDCKQLECGCVVSCNKKGGMVVGCNNLSCSFIEWKKEHRPCKDCGMCDRCGKCICPGRFGR